VPQICRVGDSHACGNSDADGSPDVFANGSPVHRIGDSHAHGAVQVGGSGTVFVNGRGVARIGDNQSPDSLLHPPNPQVSGSPDVFAGG
jgi:uncharacterized Zn-binding protein involved in type VI secretion